MRHGKPFSKMVALLSISSQNVSEFLLFCILNHTRYCPSCSLFTDSFKDSSVLSNQLKHGSTDANLFFYISLPPFKGTVFISELQNQGIYNRLLCSHLFLTINVSFYDHKVNTQLFWIVQKTEVSKNKIKNSATQTQPLLTFYYVFPCIVNIYVIYIYSTIESC